jgi:two-component system OmpR family sensor kinase
VRVSLLPGTTGEVGVVVRDDGTGDARAIAAGPPRERRGRRAGAGLGLSIARAIVAAHGGSITVEPADPGVRFVLRLPAEPDDEHDPDPETAVHPAAEEATGA